MLLLSDGQANQGLVNEQEIFARVTKAAGAEPSPEPLLDYLEAKFGEIYGL